MIQFIDSVEYDYKDGDVITVILPEFVLSKLWQRTLHNASGRHLSNMLLKYHHIVVARMPFHLMGEGLLFSE